MADTAVIVDRGVLNGDPIRAISFLPPEGSWDSGFAAWSVPPERAADVDVQLICVDCLLDDFPEAGKGMDVARQHGEALRRGDGWTTR
jgi:hypothetical protein